MEDEVQIEILQNKLIELNEKIGQIGSQTGIPKDTAIELRGFEDETAYWAWRRDAMGALRRFKAKREKITLEIQSLKAKLAAKRKALAIEQNNKVSEGKVLARLISRHEEAMKNADILGIDIDDHIVIIAKAKKLIGQAVTGKMNEEEAISLLQVMEFIVTNKAYEYANAELSS